MDLSYIARNFKDIEKKVSEKAIAGNKQSRQIAIIAVTKKASAEETLFLIENTDAKAIAESRVLQAYSKFSYLAERSVKFRKIKKHFIGHLQRNKAKYAVELFDVIQSVDSIRIAEEINKRALSIGKVQEAFIEVNIAGESTKYGISPENAEEFYMKLLKLTSIKITGLMCIAPFLEKELTRKYFRKLFELNKKLKLDWLSMGMTNDFEVAIEEGSNMVRIGTAIFKKPEKNS